jgi:hypothetical protein
VKLPLPRGLPSPYVKAGFRNQRQRAFLFDQTKEAMFGGAAGGGKSYALLMGALQYVDVPHYAALILRRTYKELSMEGALMDVAHAWLDDTDAHWNGIDAKWVFPSGASLTFGYIANDNDRFRYQGAAFQYVAFDELTQWPTDVGYRYLFSRSRRPAVPCMECLTPLNRVAGLWRHAQATPCDHPQPDPVSLAAFPPAPDGTTLFTVPLRMRAASNPGGLGHDWVKARFIKPRPPLTVRRFYPSKLGDNPYLDQATYRRDQLGQLPLLTRLQLEHGDWETREAGRLFDRRWFIEAREAV